MRAVDPALAEIHPHAFRHHFNYELSVSIDQNNARIRLEAVGSRAPPISEDRELDVRAFLNGHRSKASGAAYNRRHHRETRARKGVVYGQSGYVRLVRGGGGRIKKKQKK